MQGSAQVSVFVCGLSGMVNFQGKGSWDVNKICNTTSLSVSSNSVE